VRKPKDLFSKQAAAYRQFRPEYPPKLYTLILKHVQGREAAWDCGTGNGQVAAVLADYFDEVEATDISVSQLKNAIEKENVYYQLCQSEKTHFDDNTFDLITVAQAAHWFHFEDFYKEVRRVAKSSAIIAIWGYGLFRVNPEIDALIDTFYSEVTGPYWDSERRYIDDEYRSLPFPFREIGTDNSFTILKTWTLADLEGFLNTWSAIQHYVEAKGENPIGRLLTKLKPHWPAEERREVSFPIFLKLGHVF
jgi:ubiquinone/menaquinone biosynthesis C-methylase UbiE